jgi:hypothetical protein
MLLSPIEKSNDHIRARTFDLLPCCALPPQTTLRHVHSTPSAITNLELCWNLTYSEDNVQFSNCSSQRREPNSDATRFFFTWLFNDTVTIKPAYFQAKNCSKYVTVVQSIP